MDVPLPDQLITRRTSSMVQYAAQDPIIFGPRVLAGVGVGVTAGTSAADFFQPTPLANRDGALSLKPSMRQRRGRMHSSVRVHVTRVLKRD